MTLEEAAEAHRAATIRLIEANRRHKQASDDLKEAARITQEMQEQVDATKVDLIKHAGGQFWSPVHSCYMRLVNGEEIPCR